MSRRLPYSRRSKKQAPILGALSPIGEHYLCQVHVHTNEAGHVDDNQTTVQCGTDPTALPPPLPVVVNKAAPSEAATEPAATEPAAPTPAPNDNWVNVETSPTVNEKTLENGTWIRLLDSKTQTFKEGALFRKKKGTWNYIRGTKFNTNGWKNVTVKTDRDGNVLMYPNPGNEEEGFVTADTGGSDSESEVSDSDDKLLDAIRSAADETDSTVAAADSVVSASADSTVAAAPPEPRRSARLAAQGATQR